MPMKRIDYIKAAQLLARKGIVVNDATMLLAVRYATGSREGDIDMSWDMWMDEDLDLDDSEDEQDTESDPTEPEAETPSEISTTKWPSSVNSSKDSAPATTGS